MILRTVDDFWIERNGTPPYVNSIQLQAQFAKKRRRIETEDKRRY